jgi:hypothetical protein
MKPAKTPLDELQAENARLRDDLDAAWTALDGIEALLGVLSGGRTPRTPPGSRRAAAP